MNSITAEWRGVMIDYLVQRAYPTAHKNRYASRPQMFRAELQGQSDHVLVVLYESAVDYAKKLKAAREVKRGL